MNVKILIGVVMIILLSNIIKMPSIGKSYAYQTINEKFTYGCVPSKGNHESDMLHSFEEFKSKNPEFQNLVLYRTFEKKWWKFWNWREYLMVERWQYPFLN